MNLLLLDSSRAGLSFALRASSAGHDVRRYAPGAGNMAEISAVDNWAQHAVWADLIVSTESTSAVDRLKFFIDRGCPVFGHCSGAIRKVAAPTVPMRVSRFLGSSGWVGQWLEEFAYIRMLAGDYGPEHPAGSVAYFTEQSKLGGEILGPLGGELAACGYRGLITLCGDTISCRPAWPLMNFVLGATKNDPIQWMLDCLAGRDTTAFREDIGCCISVSAIAPKPTKVLGITRGTRQHVHPQSVCETDSGWVVDGRNVLSVTGYGKSVAQATKRAYSTLSKVRVIDAIVRDDIGEDLKRTLPKLHERGYALACQYV